MSYTSTVFIGYYAEITPTNNIIQADATETRECSKNGERPTVGSFCSTCGAPIITVVNPKTQSMARAFHFWDERDPEQLNIDTLGRATVKDLLALENCHPIFHNGKKELIMLPGHTKLSDINNEGGVYPINIHTVSFPEPKVISLLHKIFGINAISFDNFDIAYGAIVEVR